MGKIERWREERENRKKVFSRKKVGSREARKKGGARRKGAVAVHVGLLKMVGL